MKFCKNCGTQIDDNAIFCHNCGARTNGDNPQNAYGFNPYDNRGYFGVDSRGSILISAFSFCIWYIGLLLWFFYRNTRPGKAASAMKGALAGVSFQYPVVGLILWLLWRKDPLERELAKVSAISAIVGASLGVVSAIVLFILAMSGNLVMPELDLGTDFAGGAGAVFTYLTTFFR